MKDIQNFDEIGKLIEENENILFYGSDPWCIVCQDMKPQVDKLSEKLNIPIYNIDITENPVARGQLSLFTAPVVMLYNNGKEVYRQGRFLDLEKLEYVINNFKNN